MSIFSQIYNFMFAPAGTFDSSSDLYDASNDSSFHHHTHITEVNPATGLPMIDCGDGIGGISGIDVGGSPYGIDTHHHDCFSAANDSNMFSNDCNSMFDTGISPTDFSCKFD